MTEESSTEATAQTPTTPTTSTQTPQVGAIGVSPTPPVTAPPGTSESTWNYDKEIAGVGDKPEWFNSEKYATILDQAKAQPEAEKLLGQFKGAPEVYEPVLNKEFVDNKITVDTENPLYQKFSEIAKNGNMSPEMFNEMVNTFIGFEQQAVAQNTEATEIENAEFEKAEIAKLGSDGVERINALKVWGKNALSPEHYEVLKALATDAKTIEMLEGLKSTQPYSAVSAERTVVHDSMTRPEMQKLQSDVRYGRDRDYTKEVDAKARHFYSNPNNLRVRYGKAPT